MKKDSEMITGIERLQNPRLNKSTAFTDEERRRYKLEGLLPIEVCDQNHQLLRVRENLSRKTTNIERYIFLMALHARNERLFYRLVQENIREMLPLIYTPTVGEACQQFAHIYRQHMGMTISVKHRGRIREVLKCWPDEDVRMIVVTDGERILGLGDLGANGMGIPVGKLMLYTACAGIPPEHCMPVMLDVGTNNEELINDPLYLGLRQPRLQGEDYLSLVDEFVEAVQEVYPRALIQFEDFLTPNAYGLLQRYRDRVLCFNDDIQGTAAMALAGVYASCRIHKKDFRDLKVLFLGAGSAATGIGDLIRQAFVKAGLSEEEARQRLWFVDEHGLICAERDDLMPHNQHYAHEAPYLSFHGALNYVKPDVLIGATGVGGTFTRKVIKTMCAHNERPVIMALSNPTSRSECTAEQAYEWSDGKAIFASGSPFDPIEIDGRRLVPGQGNNVYIFPGLGLGALVADARVIPDELFLVAAETLAAQVSNTELVSGTIYPSLNRIQKISVAVAKAVAERAFELGLNRTEPPEDLDAVLSAMRYDPVY